MIGSVRRFLVTCVCVLGFVLSSTVLNGNLVLCRHGDGDSRIEWGPCATDDSGNCLSCCGDSAGSESQQPQPCKDTPVKTDAHVVKTPRSSTPQPAWGPAPVVAILAPPVMAEPMRAGGPPLSIRGRPPDSLARLRTVVLLV